MFFWDAVTYLKIFCFHTDSLHLHYHGTYNCYLCLRFRSQGIVFQSCSLNTNSALSIVHCPSTPYHTLSYPCVYEQFAVSGGAWLRQVNELSVAVQLRQKWYSRKWKWRWFWTYQHSSWGASWTIFGTSVRMTRELLIGSSWKMSFQPLTSASFTLPSASLPPRSWR